ncbi:MULTISPECIES: hypothetical protein [Paenibacillus]|uniref:hypothetical protein n=1 Tax=Paenibacillus TaxID=44249 RepID=UPI000B826DD4|nr:hypothetical protein [Paenibacillus amylolyticus]
MGDIHKVAEPDHIIKDIVAKFSCRVLWSEGRPCLEYQREEELTQIEEYIRTVYNVELLDVFFTAVESLPVEP